MACPSRAAPGEDSGDGTVPSPSSIHHVSLPAVPPRVGNSLPSRLDTSGDVLPAPTSRLQLGPDPLLFASPSLPRSPARVHQKAIVRACLHPTTIPRSGGQLVLPLSCIFPEGSAPAGAPFPINPSRGEGGEAAAETRRVTRPAGTWENPSLFRRLRRCRHPREMAGSSFEAACPPPPSACQLPSPPRLPTKASWVGAGAGGMPRFGVRRAARGGDARYGVGGWVFLERWW